MKELVSYKWWIPTALVMAACFGIGVAILPASVGFLYPLSLGAISGFIGRGAGLLIPATPAPAVADKVS